jgi:hypothetical protein
VDGFDALEDLVGMQGLGGPLEDVVNHIYLGHTLSGDFWLRLALLQALQSFQLSLQGNGQGINDRFLNSGFIPTPSFPSGGGPGWVH